uniref:Odorant receptor n=1 Tax=Leucinodes orbonalis TaxID=711050 RepID=A0AAU0QMN1_9NEOP|nr:odorant receptor [Leucinodes orbonalis]
MSTSDQIELTTKTEIFFSKLCHIAYLHGFPNLWITDLNFSKTFKKYHFIIYKTLDVIFYLFIISQWTASLKQHNLTQKQMSDNLLFSYAQPSLYSYRLALDYHQDKIREIIFNVFVKLKGLHNDEKLEKKMIRKTTILSLVFLTMVCSCLVFFGCQGIYADDAKFVTVITIWPDVEDTRLVAYLGRVVIYIIWWLLIMNVMASYNAVLTLMVTLEYQFKYLGKYFRELDLIFEEDISQKEKERKYYEGVKLGISLHSIILRCVELTQDSCTNVYGLHILVNISVLVSVMFQMVYTGRDLDSVFSTLATGTAMLISTGYFMWCAGDVTVEASFLATDMYFSGWHNCGENAPRVRRLLILAMMQAQNPVEITIMGVFTVSYQAFLSIVKSSYTIFTVLY